MKRISYIVPTVWLLLAVLANVSPALGQVLITGQVVGTVQDQSGAVVPDVKLQLQDEATKAIRSTTSGADGGFVFVSLTPSNYDLTATKEGFETAVYIGIVVYAARTTNQTVTLVVGKLAQTVEVAGAAPILQTTTTTLSTTVETKGLNDLPLAGRAVLPFALLMPGVQRTTSDRDSTFNGLPGGAINTTYDGINNSSQRFKTAGTSFWAFTNPQLESVDEITVSTSNLGGNSAGQGAMQIQMFPKTGTNAFHGELFEQHQNAALNANTWFNNATGTKRPKYILNDFGVTVGGPIRRNKLFFFVGFSESNQPSSLANESWFLTPLAQSGTFTYTGTDGNKYTANLLQLAGAAGFPSTIDPIIGAQQQKINSSLSGVPTAAISSVDANINDIRWVQPVKYVDMYPTLRLDYNISEKLRVNLTGQYLHRHDSNTTLPPFPGPDFKQFSYGYGTEYYIGDAGFSWTLQPNLTNELKLGVQSNRENFNVGAVINQFLPRCMDWPLGLESGLDWYNGQYICSNAPWIRNNPVYNFVDNLSWVRGSHSVTAGGDVLRTTMYETSWTSGFGPAGIPVYEIGIASGDPAGSLFTTLPAISSDDLSYAQSLYALLTGRLSSVITGRYVNEHTHQYTDLSPNTDREKLVSFGLYLQDSWRANRSLTLDYGLRWDFQGDDENTNGLYSSPTLADLYGPSGALPSGAPNLFNPGALLGIQNPNIWQRSKTYNRDYIAPAPHVGIAWNPSFGEGLLKTMFGDRKTVFRGGFAINFFGEDMINFQDSAGLNPGRDQYVYLYPGMPGFAPGGLSISSPLPPYGAYPESFSFPIPLSDFTFSGTTIYTDNPNLRAPYVENWSAGVQRELTSSTVLEVRYAGNRSVHLWHQYNLNEVNIFENGFLQQFLTAQKNLATNGGASFAPTAATPTPIFDAAFAGLPPDQGYANGSFISMLQTGQAGGLASSLAGSSIYLCNLVGSSFSPCGFSGGTYPINFFQLNPYMAGGAAQILSDDSFSTYNGLQTELRRKLASGLTFDVNYTWSHTLTDRNNKSTTSFSNWTTLRDLRLNKCPSPWDIRHTFVAYGTYDLPFGRGRKFSVSNSAANEIVGGWTAGGIFRIRSGVPFELSSGRSTFNDQDSGVTLPNGVTASQIQSMVGTYRSGEPQIFFVDPTKLKGSDGRANPTYLAAPTTPGVLGGFMYLYGPKLVTTDLSLSKRFRVTERYRLEFQSEFLNAFNHPDFQNGSVYVYGVSPVSIRSTTFGRTTTTAIGPRNIQFRLRFLF